MRLSVHVTALFSAFVFVKGQDASFCKEDDCADCPTSLATAGTGYPECVIYDTETVFGGFGFREGEGNIRYLTHGDFQDPCGGQPGSFIIRSPARRAQVGCGNIIFSTVEAQCSVELAIQDTFSKLFMPRDVVLAALDMDRKVFETDRYSRDYSSLESEVQAADSNTVVQFCCGSGDCAAAGVPWGKRQDSTKLVGASNGLQGAYLKFANGSIIPPLETGPPPDVITRQDDCNGFKDGSYIADGDVYLKTFDTITVSPTVGPFTEDTEIDVTYDQSVSRTTSFDASIGDPFGIISLSVNVAFEDSRSEGFTIKVPVPAGQQGVVGFTPVYQCTTGTLEDCDGVRTEPGETCTAFLTGNGFVEGDYLLIQS